jgi:hypothetical protein
MSDKLKLTLAGLMLIGSLVLPLVGLVYGWWNWDLITGIVIMTLVFIFMLVGSGLLLLRISELSWFSVYLPYLFGAVYSFLPDSIVYSIDDAAATSVGAVLSYALTLRKQPNTPRWVILPLIAAGIYALFGGAIPGTGDELLIDIIAFAISWLGIRKSQGSS